MNPGWRVAWSLIALAAVVGGCASAPAQHPPADASTPQNVKASAPAPRFNLTGYSVAFKEGFGDACAKRRDEDRFKTEVDYQMGWSDGQSLCPR
jgi:hypothetical protein